MGFADCLPLVLINAMDALEVANPRTVCGRKLLEHFPTSWQIALDEAFLGDIWTPGNLADLPPQTSGTASAGFTRHPLGHRHCSHGCFRARSPHPDPQTRPWRQGSGSDAWRLRTNRWPRRNSTSCQLSGRIQDTTKCSATSHRSDRERIQSRCHNPHQRQGRRWENNCAWTMTGDVLNLAS